MAEARALGLRPSAMGEGRAFWWLQVPARPDPSVSYRVVEEDDLTGDERAAVHTLLADNLVHGRRERAERGYRVLRPSFRVLAYRGSRLVGTTSTVWVRTEPAVRMAGLADGAVDPRRRGAGIGSELLRGCVAGALGRGAEAILTDTTHFARVCARHGFRRPREGELRFAAADGRPRHWWLRWEDESQARPFELIDDDF